MSLDFFKAFVLGVVEGLTEFIPVSSTGHLLLLQRFFGFDDDDFGKTFVVLIQLGAILAILSVYFAKLWRIFIGSFSRRIAMVCGPTASVTLLRVTGNRNGTGSASAFASPHCNGSCARVSTAPRCVTQQHC